MWTLSHRLAKTAHRQHLPTNRHHLLPAARHSRFDKSNLCSTADGSRSLEYTHHLPTESPPHRPKNAWRTPYAIPARLTRQASIQARACLASVMHFCGGFGGEGGL
eukprot:scaffold8073_cov19-Prasinocladus_malaysianus.AAC.1